MTMAPGGCAHHGGTVTTQIHQQWRTLGTMASRIRLWEERGLDWVFARVQGMGMELVPVRGQGWQALGRTRESAPMATALG